MLKAELKRLFDDISNITEKAYFNKFMIGKLRCEKDVLVKISIIEDRRDYPVRFFGYTVDIINKTTGRINSQTFKFSDYLKNPSINMYFSIGYTMNDPVIEWDKYYSNEFHDNAEKSMRCEIEEYLKFFVCNKK